MSATLKRHPFNATVRYFQVGKVRYYVKKTNLRTWVVATSYPFSLDEMVEIGGEYHFSTLRDLRQAIASMED